MIELPLTAPEPEGGKAYCANHSLRVNGSFLRADLISPAMLGEGEYAQHLKIQLLENLFSKKLAAKTCKLN